MCGLGSGFGSGSGLELGFAHLLECAAELLRVDDAVAVRVEGSVQLHSRGGVTGRYRVVREVRRYGEGGKREDVLW